MHWHLSQMLLEQAGGKEGAACFLSGFWPHILFATQHQSQPYQQQQQQQQQANDSSSMQTGHATTTAL
jgi:hypothetical protein